MLPLLGLLILLLLLVDVFLTVFHAQGRGGPITRRQNRLVWSTFRSFGARADGTPRAGLLAFAGPAMPVITLFIWIVLLVLGFSLIYYPWVTSFLVSPGNLRAPWAEALYYSGYVAATLGFGDVVANSETLRLLTVVEAFSGFALLTVSITYVLAVYRELLTMHTLASNIDGYFRSGDIDTLKLARSSGYDALARWGEDVTNQMLRVLQAHFQYPILHYFRPTEQSRALPVQLGHLVSLRRLAREGAPADPTSALEAHPSFRALRDAVEEYLRQVDQRFIPDRIDTQETAGDIDDTERAHQRLLSYMRYGSQTGYRG